jgi:hypothetical protein
MLRAAVLVFVISLCFAEAAQGKPGKLFSELIGCWQIEQIGELDGKKLRSGQDLCLGKGGKMIAGWFNWEEGIRSSGTYRIKGKVLTILRDAGVGWPGSQPVNRCELALVRNGDELILRDCDFQGDWKRLCRNMKEDEHSIPGCVKYPAN